jgi:6-phosphogluconate dehydrogenase (decarboxylating)
LSLWTGIADWTKGSAEEWRQSSSHFCSLLHVSIEHLWIKQAGDTADVGSAEPYDFLFEGVARLLVGQHVVQMWD